MNFKMGALLIVTALAGFSGSCSQPPAQTASGTQADIASSGQSAPGQAEATVLAAAQANVPLAGEYEGEFDGGSAAVTISGSAPHYDVHIIVGGDGCGGGALGPAQVDGAGVVTVRPTDDASCTITMTPAAAGFSVAENHCSNLHGASCAFSGELHRAH